MEKLFADYKQLMYKTAYSILNNPEDSENAVQEAFLRVIKNVSKFRTYSCNENASYLVIIVRGIALNMYNKNKNIFELDNNFPSADSVDREAESDITYERIVQYIESLTPALRNIATLLWVQNLTEAEVSELLDMNINTVRSSASRARKLLKKMIEEDNRNDQ